MLDSCSARHLKKIRATPAPLLLLAADMRIEIWLVHLKVLMMQLLHIERTPKASQPDKTTTPNATRQRNATNATHNTVATAGDLTAAITQLLPVGVAIDDWL